MDSDPHLDGREVSRSPVFTLLIEPCHLPVDGHGGPDGSLGGIFQGDGGAEQGHDPVAGHLVDRAFVVMDLMDEDLVDLVHQGIDRLRAEFLGQGREALHVAEHDRDLLAFPFDLVPLGEDLLGDAGGQVLLDLGDLLVKGEVFGR